MAKRGRKSKTKEEVIEEFVEEEKEVVSPKPSIPTPPQRELSLKERAAVLQKGGGYLYAVKFIVNVNNLPQNPGEIAGFSERMADNLVREGFAVFVDVSRE